MKAKVIDYHTLKRQWSAPGVPQVEPRFIVFPFFTKEDGATFSMRYHTILTEEGETAVQEGMVVFIPSNLPHLMVCRGELPWITIDCISMV